jgi:translation initiation factor RLI1
MTGISPWLGRRKIEARSEEHTYEKTIHNDKNKNIIDDDVNEDDISSNSKTIRTIKIITDEPTLEDALDFDRYSQELADIIRNSTPRFAVGVFGGWGTGKTTLMKMIEANLLKGEYVFNWERVPEYSSDNTNLKTYLKENIDDLDWIDRKEFAKSKDGKTLSIYKDNNNNQNSLSISIDNNTTSVSLSVNGN